MIPKKILTLQTRRVLKKKRLRELFYVQLTGMSVRDSGKNKLKKVPH